MKKSGLFWVFLVLLVLFVAEWTGRVFLICIAYRQAQSERQDVQWRIDYEQMRRRDTELGYYFDATGRKTLMSSEFVNHFELVDLGVDILRFRDDGLDLQRSARWLAVGDSFVWGVGVELADTFAEQLERLDGDLDVINAGISGYTPEQYTRMIRRFVKNDIRFDAVLYNFFGGNDNLCEYDFQQWSHLIAKFPHLATPNYLNTSIIAQQGVERELARRSLQIDTAPGFLETFLARWSASFVGVRRLYRVITGDLHPETLFKFSTSARPRIETAPNTTTYIFPFNPTVKGTNGAEITLATRDVNSVSGENLSEIDSDYHAMYELNFPLTTQSILEGKEYCDRIEASFYLVYVPSKAEVYASALCLTLPEPLKSEVQWQMNRLREQILAFCQSHSISVIDLTEVCRHHEKLGEQLYYNVDSHFNKNGHRLWAEVIY